MLDEFQFSIKASMPQKRSASNNHFIKAFFKINIKNENEVTYLNAKVVQALTVVKKSQVVPS